MGEEILKTMGVRCEALFAKGLGLFSWCYMALLADMIWSSRSWI